MSAVNTYQRPLVSVNKTNGKRYVEWEEQKRERRKGEEREKGGCPTWVDGAEIITNDEFWMRKK